jgi:hypothetical protein
MAKDIKKKDEVKEEKKEVKVNQVGEKVIDEGQFHAKGK